MVNKEMQNVKKEKRGRGREKKSDEDIQTKLINVRLAENEIKRLDTYINKMNINNRSVGIRKMLFDVIDEYDRQQVN